MNRTVSRYLEKRTHCDRWPLEGDASGLWRSIVVIPALGEFPGIVDTLNDLSACDGCDDTLVIVVVNNRTPDHASAEDVTANQQTLTALKGWDPHRLRVAWIDASSPGLELPDKEGVGLARKIGLDWGLQILTQINRLSAPLVCLDGDTRVDPTYLDALHRFFESPDRWAGVLPYAHPVEGSESEQAAILCYEFFLRYHADQLAWAGSPYGYHAIGSAMACTGLAYAAVTGMNRRLAGEDFYFLQQLAKTGTIQTVPGTVVRPSGRASHRVPFGTGRRVQRFLDGDEEEYLLYHPASYDVIRRWLLTPHKWGEDGTGHQLMEAAAEIQPELAAYLQAAKFPDAWDRMRKQGAGRPLLNRFDQWFDGFRTLKCIHHLRDTVSPDASMFEAIGSALARRGLAPVVPLTPTLRHDLAGQKRLLEQLRETQP